MWELDGPWNILRCYSFVYLTRDGWLFLSRRPTDATSSIQLVQNFDLKELPSFRRCAPCREYDKLGEHELFREKSPAIAPNFSLQNENGQGVLYIKFADRKILHIKPQLDWKQCEKMRKGNDCLQAFQSFFDECFKSCHLENIRRAQGYGWTLHEWYDNLANVEYLLGMPS